MILHFIFNSTIIMILYLLFSSPEIILYFPFMSIVKMILNHIQPPQWILCLLFYSTVIVILYRLFNSTVILSKLYYTIDNVIIILYFLFTSTEILRVYCILQEARHQYTDSTHLLPSIINLTELHHMTNTQFTKPADCYWMADYMLVCEPACLEKQR